MQFVFFGNDWFAENRTSSHHIAKRLGARFPLLYIETPGLRSPKASGRDIRKLLRKALRAFRPPELVAPHFWVMTLPQIPFRRFAIVQMINRGLSRIIVRRAIRKIGLKDIVSWFHVPHPGFLAHCLGERLTVFYCIDDYSRLPGVDGRSVSAMDREITMKSDIVFACNQSLVEARRPLNQRIFLSPHGVDTELFSRAAHVDTAEPEQLQSAARPIIGFWGLLDDRVDFSILNDIATLRPNWTILLVGRIAVDVTALRKLRNVLCVGSKPYSELPHWAKAMDVCILPYVQNTLVQQSSPLKLKEFLAAGKPVISVPIPEANLMGEVVNFAENGNGFVNAIELALAEDKPESAEARQRFVAGSTWDDTVSLILAKINTATGATF